ncbi:MAG: PorP/SprF family type IX secretion system membrane protein, partial [Bacteroidales bacterium]|nr:PorP/SprF family type IX secretion system membrane protein [Bacteroidales bacterium]
MNTGIKVLLWMMCILGFAGVRAQDPHFSQYFAHPLYINPAFAGANECPRINLGYRNQWPNIGGGFSTMSVSYDQHIHAIRGGLGAKVFADIQGGGTYRNISASVMYSYRFKLGRSFSLRLAAEAAYVNRYANWTSLTFPDQFDPMLGLVRPTTDEDLSQTPLDRHYADFTVGALAYNDNFYVGVSVDHLSRPDEGFMGVQRLAIKYTAHVGGVIYFRKVYNTKRSEKDISLSPNLIFTQQGK